MEAIWGNLLLYMCIFTPSCLPSKESGKQGRTPPHMLCSHSLLSPGRTKTLSHWPPQPPPAQGLPTSQSEKWVLNGPWGVRIFISFSKASMRKQQQQHREGRLRGQPHPLFLTATSSPRPSPLCSQHSSTSSQPVSRRVALYHRNCSFPILSISRLDSSAIVWASPYSPATVNCLCWIRKTPFVWPEDGRTREVGRGGGLG